MSDKEKRTEGDPPQSSAEGGGQKRKREDSSSNGSETASSEQPGSPVPNWIVAGASPPRFVHLEELMNAAVGLDKMALAHEIAIDNRFKLEPRRPGDGSLEQKVRAEVHRAFWNILAEQLAETPPNYEKAFALLAEMKEMLYSLLLPHHSRLKDEIEERLDLDLLRQQCEHDCFDFISVANYVLDLLGKMCAPARDEKLAELRKTTEFIPLFRGIFELLDVMKLDMANFTISAFRPEIQKNSIEYEREQFQKYLDANPGGLRHTHSWIQRAFELYLDESVKASTPQQPAAKAQDVRSSPVKIAPDSGSASFDTPCSSSSRSEAAVAREDRARKSDIMSVAFWELLEWSDNRAFPETLLVDQARLYDMRNSSLQLIITVSSVVVATNLAGRAVADLPDFKNGLKEKLLILLEGCEQRVLRDRLMGVAEEIIKEISVALSQVNQRVWETHQKLSLRSQILEICQVNHPVRKLIRDRIRTFVRSVIRDPSASPIKLPPGLSLIQSELAKLTGGFLRLVMHNRQVFAEQYDRILDQVLSQQQTLVESDRISSTVSTEKSSEKPSNSDSLSNEKESPKRRDDGEQEATAATSS